MIIIARRYGQLGNRLKLAAHLMAAAREHGVGFAHPTFVQYAHFFKGTAHNLWCRFPTRENPRYLTWHWQRRALESFIPRMENIFWQTRLRTYPFQIYRLPDGQTCDLSGEEFRTMVQSRRVTLVSGWGYRSDALLHKHGDAIRRHFRPIDPHQKQVELLTAKLRKESDLVVGIHIRHGDFATWGDGKYFYSMGEYANAMREVKNQFSNKKIAFLVCTNGQFTPNDFKDLRVHLGTGHLVEDMYSLAQTDFIIGSPRSTFSQWSSFYGQKPLVEMTSADLPTDLSSVKHLTALDSQGMDPTQAKSIH